ncbi:MAG: hypothetical protein ABI563_06840 [Specibacter sp.]
MEHSALDAKSQLRLQALNRWAVDAAGSGHEVPTAAHLEQIAVAKNAGHAGIDSALVQAWAATLNWLMTQAAFGVADPYLQLPDSLRVPSEVTVVSLVVASEATAGAGVAVTVEAVAAAVQTPTKPAKPPAPNTPEAVPSSRMPKWESAAREQVLEAIKRYRKPLHDLKARDANEGDTRLVVTDILCEGLDYDKFRDLTTEYMVRQDFADYGVRIDKQLVAFIEVKRISQKLNERHLRQVQMYAVNEGIEWMVLTNGAVWQAYHLTGGLPVVVNMAFEIDLLGPASLDEKAELMFLLHREALKRRRIDESWKHRAATEPGALLDVILSEAILDQIRREVKRRTGTTTTPEALSQVIRTEIVDPKLMAKLFKP